MDTAAAVALWVAGIAAGIAGLGYIARKIVQGVRALLQLGRKLDVLADIASYELQHNHGHSIKDAVTKIPAIGDALHQHLDASAAHWAEVDHRLDALEQGASKTIANLAEALPVVARSTPAEVHQVEENGEQQHGLPQGP